MVKKDKLASLNAAYSIIEKEKDRKKHIYVNGIELRRGVAARSPWHG